MFYRLITLSSLTLAINLSLIGRRSLVASGRPDNNNNNKVYYLQDYCHSLTINHRIHIGGPADDEDNNSSDDQKKSVIIRASRGPGGYKSDMDCQLRVVNRDPRRSGLNINLNYLDLRKSSSAEGSAPPNNPYFRDYLVIKFDDNYTNLWYDSDLIGHNNSPAGDRLVASGDGLLVIGRADRPDEVVIKFVTTTSHHNNNKRPVSEDNGFELIVTQFKDNTAADGGDTDGRNNNDMNSCTKRSLFDCGNGLCIDRRFRCNGYDNCGNNRDEEDNCKISRQNNYFDLFETGFWFGFQIVMGLLLVGLLLAIMSCLCQKYDENARFRKQFLQNQMKRYQLRTGGTVFASTLQTRTPLYPQLYRTYGGTEA